MAFPAVSAGVLAPSKDLLTRESRSVSKVSVVSGLNLVCRLDLSRTLITAKRGSYFFCKFFEVEGLYTFDGFNEKLPLFS